VVINSSGMPSAWSEMTEFQFGKVFIFREGNDEKIKQKAFEQSKMVRRLCLICTGYVAIMLLERNGGLREALVGKKVIFD